MASAVRQLQGDALNQSVPLSDLLRRAYVIARKLDLEKFQQWIRNERDGYEYVDQDELPAYRIMTGQLRSWNPFHGWQPVIFESPTEAEIASRRGVGQAVAELEDLLQGGDARSLLHIPLPHAAQRRMSQSVGFDTQFSLFVPRQGIVRILDAVRNALLEWALKLEEEGVIGEGLTFTEQEKQTATGLPKNVTNFFGTVGQASLQQAGRDAVRVTANIDLDEVRELVSSLQKEIEQLGLADGPQAEFHAEISTIDAQIRSPNPKRGIIKESLGSLRRILEGAGGGVAGKLAIEVGRVLLGAP